VGFVVKDYNIVDVKEDYDPAISKEALSLRDWFKA
jgi:hypothetical protein